MTFLIIDDNPTDRLIARLTIQRKYDTAEIIEIECAQAGISWLVENSQKKNVLILLDIRMPEIDGFGFLSLYEQLSDSLKEDKEIIMISSTLDTIDIQRAHDHKCVKELLEKPLDLQKLIMVSELA